MCGFVGFIDENDQTYDHPRHHRRYGQCHRPSRARFEGYFSDGRAALGFRRLAIIDLAGANQPLYNENRSLVLVFNGEIYNYRELRRQLIAAGHTFYPGRCGSDTPRVRAVGRRRVLDRLRGMFAFALYRPAATESFSARDAFGIKPLYYAVEGDRILFGSRSRADHAPARTPEPERAAARPLAVHGVPARRGDPVRRRPQVARRPLAAMARRPRRTRPLVRPSFVPTRGAVWKESAEAIEATLRESVAAHAIADVDVGCFPLGRGGFQPRGPGGRLHHGGAHVHHRLGEGRFSELEPPQPSPGPPGCRTRGILDAEQFFASVPAVQYAMDEPLPNPSAVPLYHLCAMAAESVKVVLSGEGGDELFGGYPYYQECLAFAPYMMPCPHPPAGP